MAKIELRKDDWFDIGKDAPTNTIFFAIYQSKQAMKKDIEKIGEKKSVGELEKAICEISPQPSFEKIFLNGKDIYATTPNGMPEKCYLGKIMN